MYDYSKEQIRNSLLDYRKRFSLSQREAAFYIGVTPVTITRWETGVTRPRGVGILLRMRELGILKTGYLPVSATMGFPTKKNIRKDVDKKKTKA